MKFDQVFCYMDINELETDEPAIIFTNDEKELFINNDENDDIIDSLIDDLYNQAKNQKEDLDKDEFINNFMSYDFKYYNNLKVLDINKNINTDFCYAFKQAYIEKYNWRYDNYNHDIKFLVKDCFVQDGHRYIVF